MKKQADDTRQYTIRGVPREVDRALRQRAVHRKQSLNQLLLDELSALTIGERPKADFSDLCGSWTADPAFDRVIASQRRIDPAKWK